MSAHAVMRGTSMQPLLLDGMLLELSQADRVPRVGDIAVFKAGGRLIAHRIVARRGSAFVCCGDAQPDRTELVDAADIAGIVQRVYRSDGRRVRRVDTAVFRARGRVFAYLQPVRSLFERTAPHRRERTYRVLVQAATAIVRRDEAALVEAVVSAAPARLAAMARRHRMAAVLCAALEPLQSSPHARAVFELLRRWRWGAAAYMPRYRRQVLDVVRTLRGANVEIILLKGAARAFRRDAGWLQHQSGDIDVLVDPADLERAERILRQAGYGYACSPQEERRYRERHHHLAPLYPSAPGVYVELHHALHASLADRTQFAHLRRYAIRVQDGGMDALVLDQVGTALHYAIHAIDRPALRDVVLLAQQLAGMTRAQRAQLRSALRETHCVQASAHAALLVAAQMANLHEAAHARTSRFAVWMLQREDLPRVLRVRPHCVDAWFGAQESRLAAVLAAACQRRSLKSAVVRLAAAAGIALYLPFMR